MSLRPAALGLLFLPVLLAAFAGSARAGDLLDPLIDDPTCPPTDPSQGGGDQMYPTCLAAPDLTLDVGNLPGMSVGGVFVPWNGHAVVADTRAGARHRGRCGFSYLHLNVNIGGSTSVATTNAIHLWATGYPLLAASALPALTPGQGAVSTGTLWLAPGTWTLIAKADAARLVGESVESNNLRAIQVTVTGTCQ